MSHYDNQFRHNGRFAKEKIINKRKNAILAMREARKLKKETMKYNLIQGSGNDYVKEDDTLEYSDSKTSLVVDSNSRDNSLGVEVDLLNRVISYSSESQMDQLQDESDSKTHIMVDQEITNVSAVIGKDSYSLDSNAINNHEQPTDFLGNFYNRTNSHKSLKSHCQSNLFKHSLVSEGSKENGIKMEELDIKMEENGSNDDNSNDTENGLIHSEEVLLDTVKSLPNEDSDSLDVPYTPEVAEKERVQTEKDAKACQEHDKTYTTNYKLSQHMEKHPGERPFKCKSCDKAFWSKIGLAEHEAMHTGQYDFFCLTCGKGFRCKSYLTVHQRVHSDLKPFPCTTCGKNFKTKQSLLDHTNRHLGVKPYLCEICSRGFITTALCRAHEKTHTGIDNRKYSCKICQKRFVSKSYLQMHLKTHTGEKPFMCEVCPKGFLTRFDLKRHLTKHTGEKSYVCQICDKAFARREGLKCHLRSHTGERPYRCDVCGKTFTQLSSMATHRKQHTAERPFSCETCGKSFVNRSTMLSHAKKHTKKVEKDSKRAMIGLLVCDVRMLK